MKTILITGGSRGIGNAVVKKASENFNVAFTYLNSEEAANGTVSECSQHCNIRAYKCDAADSGQIKSVVKDVLRDFKKIDVLVNCAGISQSKQLQDISDGDLRRMFAVNFDGAFIFSREVLPTMLSLEGGSIINVASMWGVTGASMETHYSASKAALIGFTKALAKELAPSGITVNAVAPGAINTDMMKVYTDKEISDLTSEIPLGRLGTPEEVADAILFLADARYTTGHVLDVSGGYCI